MNVLSKHRRIVAVAAALATVGAGAALASTTSTTAKGVKAVSVVRGDDAQVMSSASFAGLPGASTTITVPKGHALLIARFNAESQCLASSWCSVRILIDGAEAAPVAGDDFAFDSKGGASYGAHAVERSALVGAGTHMITVQTESVGGGTFRLDDWQLTVESAQA
jgi:hypothetical protein